MKIFRSIEEIKKCYFPDAYKKDQWENMTLEEKGRQMAIEVFEQFKTGE